MFYAELMKLLKHSQDFEWDELERVYRLIEMLVNNEHREISPSFLSRFTSLSFEKSTILLIFLFQWGYVLIKVRVICSLGQSLGFWDMPRCETYEESYKTLLLLLGENEQIVECVHCGNDHSRTLENLMTLYFYLDLERLREEFEKKKTFHKNEEKKLKEMFPKAFQAAASL